MYCMIAWVVIFSTDSRRPPYRRHLTKIPSPQLLLFRILTNHDSPNLFRIRSYANCRVGSVFSHYGSKQLSPVTYTLRCSPTHIFFLFSFLRTLLHSREFQLFCFQPLPHSLPKTARGGLPLQMMSRKKAPRPACLRLFRAVSRIPLRISADT